jgi:hypothetical protein
MHFGSSSEKLATEIAQFGAGVTGHRFINQPDVSKNCWLNRRWLDSRGHVAIGVRTWRRERLATLSAKGGDLERIKRGELDPGFGTIG